MTRVTVSPGICSLPSQIEVRKEAGKRLQIAIRSECEMVCRLGEDLQAIERMSVFQPILENPVYRAASGQLRHASCPVPAAILKAAEVEAGFALPRDVAITFSTGSAVPTGVQESTGT